MTIQEDKHDMQDRLLQEREIREFCNWVFSKVTAKRIQAAQVLALGDRLESERKRTSK